MTWTTTQLDDDKNVQFGVKIAKSIHVKLHVVCVIGLTILRPSLSSYIGAWNVDKGFTFNFCHVYVLTFLFCRRLCCQKRCQSCMWIMKILCSTFQTTAATLTCHSSKLMKCYQSRVGSNVAYKVCRNFVCKTVSDNYKYCLIVRVNLYLYTLDLNIVQLHLM